MNGYVYVRSISRESRDVWQATSKSCLWSLSPHNKKYNNVTDDYMHWNISLCYAVLLDSHSVGTLTNDWWTTYEQKIAY